MNEDLAKKENRYVDMLHLPHHVSHKRPQMPLEDRAAQFSPFAAVVGHEAAVKETARLTDERRDLDESEKMVINDQLIDIQAKIDIGVEVEIEYFQADELKSGGQYIVISGWVKKIDAYKRCVHMIQGKVISIEDIVRIHIL